MAKALALTPDALNAPQITPKAATPARSPVKDAPKPEPEAAKSDQVPLQIRIAAAQNDQTISDFMLACFHAYMKSGKHA
jgi:hypothetical protein